MILLTDEEIIHLRVAPSLDASGYTASEYAKDVAKAQLKKVYEWGNEDCPHLSVMYGGFPPRKHECKKCWQALLEEVKE